MSSFPFYNCTYFGIPHSEGDQRSAGVIQVVAAEEAGAAAKREAADGAEETRAGQ